MAALERQLLAAEDREQAAAAAFARADVDGSGFIERSELELMLRESEAERVHEFVSAAFAKGDASQDGQLSFEEFVVINNEMNDWLHARESAQKLAAHTRRIGELEQQVVRLEAEVATLKVKMRPESKKRPKVPMVGDSVISHHWGHNYYRAKVVDFDSEAYKFTVAWDDGDETGTVQSFEQVCLDLPPEVDDIGVGSAVYFPQGTYHFAGTNGLRRYHAGRVTAIEVRDGQRVYVGEHRMGPEDGKSTQYSDYSRTFACKLDELRVCSNLLDLLSRGDSGEAIECDIFLSAAPADKQEAGALGHARAADPLDLVEQLRAAGWRVHVDDSDGEDLQRSMSAMRSAKLVVACLSNAYAATPACCSELQYVKRTLRKHLVPVIIGAEEESWDFMLSVVGILIAGDLYVDFRQRRKHAAKLQELISTARGLIEQASSVQGVSRAVAHGAGGIPCDIFVSYAWSNSASAHANAQVSELAGPPLADPRKVAIALRAAGFNPWLDIQVLGGGSGLFGDIAKGLKTAKAVVICASPQYAASENCVMEMQYALKVLKKPAVILSVGDSDAWGDTVIGLLAASHDAINLSQRAVDEPGFELAMADLVALLRTHIGTSEPVEVAGDGAAAGPVVGDSVISHHWGHNYYRATVVAFNTGTHEFTVAWEDGDTTCTVQPYEKVSLDRTPDVTDIGVGSTVLFAQGLYYFTSLDGTTTQDKMYHEGIVREIRRPADGGKTIYVGEHARGEQDGKAITSSYKHIFECELSDLRVRGNLLGSIAVEQENASSSLR